MNILRSVTLRNSRLGLQPHLNVSLPSATPTASFSSILTASVNSTFVARLLTPTNLSIVPSCGMKVKGFIRKRCKDCYFVRREGRLYVMCHTFPRHKQTHLVPKEKFTWIMSHACMSQQRPY